MNDLPRRAAEAMKSPMFDGGMLLWTEKAQWRGVCLQFRIDIMFSNIQFILDVLE